MHKLPSPETLLPPLCSHSTFRLQWQRSFCAAQWWERAALASLDNGAYADALPLMQKAQASALARQACC